MNKYRLFINPHCDNCEPDIEAMRQAVLALGLDAPEVINVLDDVDTAVKLRITRVPALVRGQQLIAQGAVDPAQLQRLMAQDPPG